MDGRFLKDDHAMRFLKTVRGHTPCTALVKSETIGRRALTVSRCLASLRRPARPWSLAWPAVVALAMNGCETEGHHPGSTPESPQDMSHEQTHLHHTIDYIELAVVDLSEAKRFYGAAFGWTFNDYGPEYAGIRRVGGGEVGGMRQDSNVQRGGTLVVLYSDDIEASVRAVQDAGGLIVKEPFEFPGGRRFHFADPAGNELAVWSYK